jgi:hypothetical protein
MDTFSDLVVWETQVNSMPPVEITGVEEKFKQLRIYYRGGNSTTDAYANFVRELSHRICEDCIPESRCDCR